MAIQIDPNTGERVVSAPQIDPLTGERVNPSPVPGAGTVDGVQLPGFPAAPAPNMQPSILGRDPNPGPVANFVKGAVKSIPGTLAGIAKLVPGASDAWQPLEQAAQTHGTAQAIGKGFGNAAQFLIPGAGEEKLGLYGASKLPLLGEYAAPIARMGASALGAGTVNKLQGGSFSAGAAGGAAGNLIGQGVRKLAPAIAEGAMGIRGADRAYGRTPGQVILDETTGRGPGAIAKQASGKVSLYSNQLDNAARQSNIPVNLQPARDTANSFLATAAERNNDATKKAVGTIGQQLTMRGTQPIPQYVSAGEGLSLKRGVGDLKTSWNPATATDFSNNAVDATQHAMHPELEQSIPGYRDLNSKISNLIPVAKRAGAKDLNAGFVQRSIGRFGAHTGALVSGVGGGVYGYKEGGVPGALAGMTLGVAGPEVIASPEAQMLAARSLYSPAMGSAIMPTANGAIQQGISLYGKKNRTN